MLTVLLFILVLGVLIFVHELGHFVVARRNGIRAEEFGFGFPPRIVGFYREKGETKWNFVWGNKEVETKETIYSINLLPLGGFVKIMGEDGSKKSDKKSFAAKSAFTRIRVLAAGVLMNFFLAWMLISLVFMIGAPEALDAGKTASENSKIQIAEVVPGTPAETAGIEVGDEILKNQSDASGAKIKFSKLEDVQNYINSNKGREIRLNLLRGKQALSVQLTPRSEYPANQGATGISMVETEIISYPWYQAIWKGLVSVLDLILAMLQAFWNLLVKLFLGQGVSADVAGPVGIAVLTGQVASLGLVYILQFMAILSINLGIINALPIPALDGGRILFILIEKIKGSPVSQKVEQIFHTVGFILLIGLMVLVTFRDVLKIVK